MSTTLWDKSKKVSQNIRKSKNGSHLQWEAKQDVEQSLSCGKNILWHCGNQKGDQSFVL